MHAFALAAVVFAFGSQPPLLDDLVEHDRRIVLGGQSFEIVKHYKRIHGRGDADGRTLTLIEIVSAAGAIAYREELSYSIEQRDFVETCDVGVDVLDGSNAKGLLLDMGCLPSAPLAGGPWRVLRLTGSVFVPVGKPLTAEGKLNGFVPGAITRLGTATQILPDTLHIRVWTGYFFVEVPIRIDWLQGDLAIARRCYSQTGHGFVEDGCEVPLTDIQRVPSERELTFVRLFSEAGETTTADHIVVKRDSRVEFLAAKVLVTRDASPEMIGLSVNDDVWLKVRIDGVEGWIHTVEDFNALGIYQSG